MGIIKAGVSAIRGAAADQWKEVFCSVEMTGDLLMTRAVRMTGSNGANNGSHEVITDGSVIIVGEGECAVATEGGKVIGIYDQPGEQIFRSNQSGGIFGGGLGAFVKDVGNRISFGGDIGISQRLYYINTKELAGGTIRAESVPLRFKDPEKGLDMDVRVSCHGSYTFHITDPALFYKAAIRSVDGRSHQALLRQMDSEVLTELGPVLTQLTREGVRPSELMEHIDTLRDALSQTMSEEWKKLRGIEVFAMALESVRVLDAAAISTLQRDAAFTDPRRAAGHLVGAQADALQTAAANEAGGHVFAAAILEKPSEEQSTWICECGSSNRGKFCPECGAKKPMTEYRCGKCGWKAEDTPRVPKFCPECGTPFHK